MTEKMTSLADQVAEQVKNYIVEQNLQPEDRLPSERKWAEQLGVSRSSV